MIHTHTYNDTEIHTLTHNINIAQTRLINLKLDFFSVNKLNTISVNSLPTNDLLSTSVGSLSRYFIFPPPLAEIEQRLVI